MEDHFTKNKKEDWDSNMQVGSFVTSGPDCYKEFYVPLLCNTLLHKPKLLIRQKGGYGKMEAILSFPFGSAALSRSDHCKNKISVRSTTCCIMYLVSFLKLLYSTYVCPEGVVSKAGGARCSWRRKAKVNCLGFVDEEVDEAEGWDGAELLYLWYNGEGNGSRERDESAKRIRLDGKERHWKGGLPMDELTDTQTDKHADRDRQAVIGREGLNIRSPFSFPFDKSQIYPSPC